MTRERTGVEVRVRSDQRLQDYDQSEDQSREAESEETKPNQRVALAFSAQE